MTWINLAITLDFNVRMAFPSSPDTSTMIVLVCIWAILFLQYTLPDKNFDLPHGT